MAGLGRPRSDNLSKQVLVMITILGLKFFIAYYSTELCLVVSRVKGREVTMEH